MTFSQCAVEAAIQAIDKLDHRKATSMADLTRKIAEAALSAALTVDGVAVQGWQPIESAPRDGTWILVSRDNGCGTDYAIVWWDDHSDDGYPWRSEFNAYVADRWDDWQPLPQPPAASDGEERK